MHIQGSQLGHLRSSETNGPRDRTSLFRLNLSIGIFFQLKRLALRPSTEEKGMWAVVERLTASSVEHASRVRTPLILRGVNFQRIILVSPLSM